MKQKLSQAEIRLRFLCPTAQIRQWSPYKGSSVVMHYVVRNANDNLEMALGSGETQIQAIREAVRRLESEIVTDKYGTWQSSTKATSARGS